MTRTLLAAALFLLWFGKSGFSQQEMAGVQYTVDLSHAKNQYVTVTLHAPATGPTTDLVMAVWTPGSYLVREYARHVDTLQAQGPDGQDLTLTKTRKNRWQVQTGDADSFSVTYRLYANEMSVRTNWTDQQFAFLNGAATFATVAGREKEPHRVQLKMPRNWTRSATSLRAEGNTPNSFVAESFDELVDSPIVAGNVNVYPFEVSGVPHQLVNVGESGYWDGTRAAADLTRVVQAHHDMWQVVPYDRYLFLNIICESGGGLEHDNSTLIMTSRWSYRDPRRYARWLNLASHEFFHAWNIRRLRPKPLVEYDYENEVYTHSLWVAEGITSYYEDLLLARCGLISRNEYLQGLSGTIAGVQRTPGRRLQSLSESSFDSWIKHYRPDENSSNTRISYYSKGALVGFLLDAKVRHLTNGAKSLDDVMRELYSRFANGVGYLPADVRAVAGEVAGADLNDWFTQVLDTTDELDYTEALSWFGIQFSGAGGGASATSRGQGRGRRGRSGAGDGSERDSRNSPSSGTRWLGIRVGSDGEVSRVEANSPATKAGINTGDEILAINGFRISGDLNSRLTQYQVGDSLKLLVARRGQLLEFELVIEVQPTQSWQLRVVSEPTEAQTAHLRAWLESSPPE